MKISHKAVFFCFILLATSLKPALSQDLEKLFESAENTFYNENFAEASVILQEILAIDESYKDAAYKLEIALHLQKENRERPISSILAYKETKARGDKFYYYWMGRIYASKYMFPEAVNAWKTFLKKRTSKSKEIVAETKNFISETKKLVSYFDNPDDYEIHQLEAPVNSTNAEMSPVYNLQKKELIYASSVGSSNDEFKIYRTAQKAKGEWTTPEEITNLGSFERDNANIEIVNEDGRLFLFKDIKGGNLYFSQLRNESWTVPVEFDSKITSTHLHSHFFINEHEDRIIFSSDQKKKRGLDLYESFRDASTGKWGKPTPFAIAIDTGWDEDSPYLSPDEKSLYFSSNRPGGLGGYDIYKSTIDDKTLTWSEPENLGWPINSPDDDFHFKLNPDGKSGYFISNRIHSMGDYDIFFFWEVSKTKLKGKIIDKITRAPISKGEIRFHPTSYLDEYFRSPINENGEYETSIIANETFKVEVIVKSDTIYSQQFRLTDDSKGQVTHIKDFLILQSGDYSEELLEDKKVNEKTNNPVTPITKNTAQIDEGNNIVNSIEDLNYKYRSGNKVILRNIYFDFGTTNLSPSSNDILKRIHNTLKANEKLVIEIGGHTDNVGTEEENLKTSLARAEAVKTWLIKKGIEKDRLIARGYGEKNPLATNDDEQDGRELNRRIEIKLVKE